ASAPFRYLWLATEGGNASLFIPVGGASEQALLDAAAGLAGVSLVDKAASVSRLFALYRTGLGYGLGVAFLAVLAVLSRRYGWRGGAAVLAPVALGIAAALAHAGYHGTPLTLFSMMALMLTLGVGVNYAIFLVEGRGRVGAAGVAVLLCAATT